MVRRGLDAVQVEVVEPLAERADALLDLFAGPGAAVPVVVARRGSGVASVGVVAEVEFMVVIVGRAGLG